MAYKATGKPRGRPKTREYSTLVARVPTDLVSRVKLYAEEHGEISVAEVIKTGLKRVVGESNGAEVQPASRIPGTAQALEEIRALLVQQQAQLQALTQAVEQLRKSRGKS